MELRHLRYFSAVAKAGSFGRAARSLRVAQPALSRQIADLEREVGAKLFVRERQGARLTPEGERVRISADAVLRSVAELGSTCRQGTSGMIGPCRLAVSPLPLLGARIGVALAAVRKRFPGIELVIREAPSSDHGRMLRAGEADIAVGTPPPQNEPGIESSVFYQDPLDSAAIPSAHALANRASVTTKQLRALPMVVLAGKSLPHVMEPVIARLKRLGFSDLEEIDTMASVTAHVAGGRGWTLVTHSQRGRPTDGYVVVPIADLRIPLSINILLRAGERSSIVHNVARAMHAVRAARWRLINTTGEADRGEGIDELTVHLGLELRHLRAFVTVMEERNLTRAAQRLQLSQPGLSRRLADLERMLEVRLFDRGERGVIPTSTAELLDRCAREALAIADGIANDVRDARRGVRGTVRVGLIVLAVNTIVPPIMQAFARECAHLDVTFRALGTHEQPRAIERGEIDIGIVHPLPGLLDDAAIDGVHLWDDRIDTVLFAENHPLAKRSSLRASDLTDEPGIFPHSQLSRGFYDLVLNSLEALGLRPKVAGTYDSPRTMWSLAANGVGWMIGAHSQRKAPPPGLVAIPLEGLSIPWGFDLLWRKGEQRDEVLEAIRVMRSTSLPLWSEM